jgi:capsular exopolysaccharide synthesis family protein
MRQLPERSNGDGNRDLARGDLRRRGYPSRARYADAYESVSSDKATGDTLLLDYWQVIRRHKGAVIVFCVLGALLGLLISLPQTPIYQARASIEIQGINENFMNLGEVNPTMSRSSRHSQADIETHVQILQSRTLIEKVADKLNLREKPEALVGTGRLASWRKALGLPPPTTESVYQQALAVATENLHVRVLGDTRIVEIRSDSTDPQMAADFANILADEYVRHSLDIRWQTTQRTGDWLNRQLGDLRIKLEQSEETLQRYARQSGLMFTSEHESVAEERLRQLQAELSQAQADRIAQQSREELARMSSQDSLPEILDADNLGQYQMSLTELRRQLAELKSTYTSSHPKVKRLMAQITALEGTIRAESAKILARIGNEYETALRREQLLAADYANQARLVSDQHSKAVQYNILKKEVEATRSLHDGLLQKVKEAGVASAMTASNIQMVDPATPPTRPYKPNHALNSAMGLLVGIFIGIVFVLLREHGDRTLRQPGDTSFYLEAPELGVIPSANAASRSTTPREKRKRNGSTKLHLNNGRGRQESGSSNGSLEPVRTSLVNLHNSVELATWQQKLSVQAECFRATLTSILFSGQGGHSPKVIVLASSLPSEGKTTIASNIAIALAEINRRVLLIDADMRRPRLHEVFDIPNTWGLSDLLAGRNALNDCPRETLARETEIPNLFVLPAGPGNRSISNLLHSPRTGELLEHVREEFDAVLIDTPPMMQMADARVLGKMADAVILVVRSGQTTRDAAKAAAARFDEDGVFVLGTILNDWSPNLGGYGYYDHYQAYSAEPYLTGDG